MSASAADLLRRLERLERQNRIMKAVGLVTLLGVGLMAAVPQQTVEYDEVRANRFVVIDDEVQKGYLGMLGTNSVLQGVKASPAKSGIRRRLLYNAKLAQRPTPRNFAIRDVVIPRSPPATLSRLGTLIC